MNHLRIAGRMIQVQDSLEGVSTPCSDGMVRVTVGGGEALKTPMMAVDGYEK
jgi:hypothetical protein